MSARYDIGRCLIEEHAMVSSSELWSKGSRQCGSSMKERERTEGTRGRWSASGVLAEIRREIESAQATEGGGKAGV